MTETTSSPSNAAHAASALPRVVVGVDGSRTSVAALREAARQAEIRGAQLVAVAAWRMPASYAGYPTGWYPEADAKAILDTAAQHAFGDSRPPHYSQLVVQGTPARVLVEESEGAAMLVVGSRGHGGFKGLMLGSVSQACAEYAKCPVLILHGEADASSPAAGQPTAARAEVG